MSDSNEAWLDALRKGERPSADLNGAEDSVREALAVRAALQRQRAADQARYAATTEECESLMLRLEQRGLLTSRTRAKPMQRRWWSAALAAGFALFAVSLSIYVRQTPVPRPDSADEVARPRGVPSTPVVIVADPQAYASDFGTRLTALGARFSIHERADGVDLSIILPPSLSAAQRLAIASELNSRQLSLPPTAQFEVRILRR